MRQLHPIRRKFIFSQFFGGDSVNYLLDFQLWHLFKYAELTEVAWKIDKLFIDLLKVRAGNSNDDVENLLKARFICESDDNYPKHAFYMYSENEPAIKRNEVVLNDLLSKI